MVISFPVSGKSRFLTPNIQNKSILLCCKTRDSLRSIYFLLPECHCINPCNFLSVKMHEVRKMGFAHFVRTSPVPAGRALASEKGLKLRFVFV